MRKARTKDLLKEFILKRAKADFPVGLTDEEVLKFIEADNKVKTSAAGSATNHNGIKTEWDMLNNIIDGMTDPDEISGVLYFVSDPNATGVTEGYKSNVMLDSAWDFMDDRNGTTYAKNTPDMNLKDALVDEIDGFATEVTATINARSAAKNDLTQLANAKKAEMPSKAAEIDAAVAAGVSAINSAYTSAAVTAARDAAMKAVRDLVTPEVTAATMEQITAAATGTFAGIDQKVWIPASVSREGSTVKITGTVFSTGNTKAIIVALQVGNNTQFISIGNDNVRYAKEHGLTYTVSYPNFPVADVITLDVSELTFE